MIEQCTRKDENNICDFANVAVGTNSRSLEDNPRTSPSYGIPSQCTECHQHLVLNAGRTAIRIMEDYIPPTEYELGMPS